MKMSKGIAALMLVLSLCGTFISVEALSESEITACSAIVLDYETGEVLFEKDADTMRVPASMTKVMTAYIIFEELEAGNLTLETLVPVSANAAQISTDTHYPACVPLTEGETISVDELLKLILVPSASASCVVMAEYISGSEEAFVQRMNDTAARLDLTAAYENCHGAKPHYITARSQALLVREFIRRFPQILNYTSLTEVEFHSTVYSNTNHLLPGMEYAYEGADGFKTGTIKAAGYCLSATAQRYGHRLISVVMHAENTAARHTDSIALLDYGFQTLDIYNSQWELKKPLAKATSQNIEVDGGQVALQTYMLIDENGNGKNYVRLRDIAHILNGTSTQFSVDYHNKTGIVLMTGHAYQDTGTEMSTPFAGEDKECVQSNLTVAINGIPVQLDAITLMDDTGNGYNYFKLRDLGAVLGFTVGYSRDHGVFVETR